MRVVEVLGLPGTGKSSIIGVAANLCTKVKKVDDILAYELPNVADKFANVSLGRVERFFRYCGFSPY